jgi:hypothetical protein
VTQSTNSRSTLAPVREAFPHFVVQDRESRDPIEPLVPG